MKRDIILRLHLVHKLHHFRKKRGFWKFVSIAMFHKYKDMRPEITRLSYRPCWQDNTFIHT